MKKLLLLAVAALMSAATAVPTYGYWKKVPHQADAAGKGRLQAGEVGDGMKIVLQTAVAKPGSGGKQGYLRAPDPQKYASGRYPKSVVLAGVDENIDEMVWTLEMNTETMSDKYQTYYLKNYATGEYLGTTGSIKDGSLLVSVATVEDGAIPFTFYAQNNAGNGGGGCTGQSPYNTAEGRGYDNYSSIISYNGNSTAKAGDMDLRKLAINCSSLTTITDETRRLDLSHWTGLRAWDVYEVDVVSGGQALLQTAIENYTADGRTPQKYVAGTTPGCYDAEAVERFNDAWNSIESAIAAGNTSEDDAQAMIDDLNAAATDVEATLVPISNGYYYIKSAATGLSAEKALTAGSALGDATAVSWTNFEPYDGRQIFRITASGTRFSIQNLVTEYYLDRPGSNASLSLEPTTLQDITALAVGGQFSLSNAAGQFYAALPATADSASVQLSRTAQAASATAWTLVPVDSSLAADLYTEGEQLRLNLALGRVLTAARAEYDATATVVGVDTDMPQVTDVAQLSTNAPETEQPALHALGNAIDGDQNTYFHTRWSGPSGATEPHYLCAYFADGIEGNVALRMTRRRSGTTYFENNWPTQAVVTASTDSLTWDTLSTLNIPNEGTSQYTSPIIALGNKGYKYLKFSVLDTPNHHASNGEMAMCFAEFNWYPAEIDASASASLRSDLQGPLAQLKAAIDEAAQIDYAQQDDIDKLQAALDAYVAVYPDPTELMTLIDGTIEQTYSDPTGDDKYGFYPTAAGEELRDYLISLGSRADLQAKTKAELDTLHTQVVRAISHYHGRLNVGQGELLLIKNVLRGTMAATQSGSLTTGSNIFVNDSATVGEYGYWQVKRTSDSTVTLQNAKTGWYIRPGDADGNILCTLSSQPYDFKVAPYGDGSLTLIEAGRTRGYLYSELGSGGVVRISSNSAAVNKGGINLWCLVAAPQPAMSTTMTVNDMQVVTLPYAVTTPLTSEGAAITAYSLVGTMKDGDGNVTAIRLHPYDDGTTIAAGTPFILESGNYTMYDPAGERITINTNIDLSAVSLASTPQAQQNGLYGTLSAVRIGSPTLGYFAGGALQRADSTSAVTIAAQTGYINVGRIADQTAGLNESDIINVEVTGDAIINGIGRTRTVTAGRVNVYTIDGVLLKQHVPAATATQGLKSGLYIVGGRKVLVQ